LKKTLDYINYIIIYRIWNPAKRILMHSSPRWLVFLIDLFSTWLSFGLAYIVRFNFSLNFDTNKVYIQSVTIIIFSSLLFFLFQPYKGVVRRTGWNDLRKIFYSSGSLMLVLWTATVLSRNGILPEILNFPYSVIFLTALFQFLALSGTRAIYKTFYYRIARTKRDPVNVLIYGTNDEAIHTFELLKNDPKRKYIFKGFVTDKPAGRRLIQGIPLISEKQIDEKFLLKEEIDEIIITEHPENPLSILDKTDKFYKIGIKIRLIPPPEKWIDNIFRLEDIKEFDLESLLERPTIFMDDGKIKENIQDKIIWVTGAAGSIGSELVRQILHYNPRKVYLLDQAETPLYEFELELREKGYDNFSSLLLDIQDIPKLEKCFRQFAPDIIFHAAAYKHVPVLEKNPYYGITVNILSSKKLMEFAVKYNVKKFIQISTDKAVNPTGIMGATKRVAELIARCIQEKSGNTQFIITRFGNVLGSNGSVIHLFKKQIKKGGPLTVTHPEINRYFMTITEAAHLVLKAAEIGKGGKIYVFDMGKPVKILDLAIKMILLSGKKYPDDIRIVFTGLRPGEKIYEELLTESELVEKTDYKKLYISKLSPLNCDSLYEKLDTLEKNINELDTEKIIEILQSIVPEYKPATHISS
jgi:FlaA1/EpsC-like NDP-sugar epimerase